MKFSTGDIIVIKRSGEEGHIVGFIGHDMAEIESGGTVFPVYLDEIDHPYLRWFTEKRKNTAGKSKAEQLPVEQQTEKGIRQPSGIHLVFFPEYTMADQEEQVRLIKIFLVNETAWTVKARYEVRIKDLLIFTHEVLLQPFSDLYLHYLDWEQMAEQPRFSWELRETVHAGYALVKDSLRIKAAKLFAEITTLQQENKASFRYTLLETFSLPEVAASTVPIQAIPPIKKRINSIKDIPRYEVDLHAESMGDNLQGLSNTEILELQLNELKRALRAAVNNMQDRLVIIHGIGKGILKEEVIRLLKADTAVSRIEPGWETGYGPGVTIAWLSY